jgi:hypothetical protein
MAAVHADLRYLLLNESGEVRVYRSLDALVGSVESYDVADGIYTAWDIDGRRIELLVSDTHRYQVEARITTVDEQRQMRAAIERWVQLSQSRHEASPPDTATWSMTELIAEAHRLQQPPPSLWQRLRHRRKRDP